MAVKAEPLHGAHNPVGQALSLSDGWNDWNDWNLWNSFGCSER
jgi:hypothetical protein